MNHNENTLKLLLFFFIISSIMSVRIKHLSLETPSDIKLKYIMNFYRVTYITMNTQVLVLNLIIASTRIRIPHIIIQSYLNFKGFIF